MGVTIIKKRPGVKGEGGRQKRPPRTKKKQPKSHTIIITLTNRHEPLSE